MADINSNHYVKTTPNDIELACAIIINFYNHYSKFEEKLSTEDKNALYPKNNYLTPKQIHIELFQIFDITEEKVTEILELLCSGWLCAKRERLSDMVYKTVIKTEYAWVIKLGSGKPYHLG